MRQLLLAALMTLPMTAWAFPVTPDLAKVGRGMAIPTTFLGEVTPAQGEHPEQTLDRVAQALRRYTDQTGFEGCARVCVSEAGQVGFRMHTNHSQIGCRNPMQDTPTQTVCPVGMTAIDRTIHTHPEKEVVWANPVDAVWANVRRGTRLTLDPHDFSARDRSNGSGYLARTDGIVFQPGDAVTPSVAVQHSDHLHGLVPAMAEGVATEALLAVTTTSEGTSEAVRVEGDFDLVEPRFLDEVLGINPWAEHETTLFSDYAPLPTWPFE